MKMVLLVLFLLFGGHADAAILGGISTSTNTSVQAQNFAISTPASTSQVVGTPTCTGACNSWTLVSQSCASYFALDASTGRITVTSTGSAALTGASNEVDCTVTVSANGSVNEVQSIAAYADGSVNAVAATQQHSTFFASYALQSGQTYTTRPPWKVAGVDYAVGYPSGQSFKDPTVDALPTGCSLNTPLTGWVGCSGAGPFTFDGWDFSLHNCVPLYFSGSTSGTITIENSKFGAGSFCNAQASYLVKIDSGSTVNLVATNNSVDGGGASDININDWVVFFSSGSYTEKYNYYANLCKGVISWGISTYTGSTGDFVSEFNYGENFTIPACAQHGEWLIPEYGNGATTTNFTYSFNTFMEGSNAANPAGGFGAQQSPVYLGGNTGHTVTTANAGHNSLVANCYSGTCSHANATTSVIGVNWQAMTVTTTNITSNYIDPTGAYNCINNATQAGVLTTVNVSGNVNLRDSSAITYDKTTNAGACNGHQ